MTTEQSRKLIEEYFSAISKDKSEEIIDKYISDEHLKSHIVIFETGLPDYQIISKDMIVEGNKVVVRFQLVGEHKGELFGQAPTGNKVDVEGIIIYELKDNKISNHWMQADSVTLMQQISNMVETNNN
ncbi:MAG TPA: ester cyclase [Anditalea sp.]|nr:ester cyclase [Anditalea sp.]